MDSIIYLSYSVIQLIKKIDYLLAYSTHKLIPVPSGLRRRSAAAW
jgi:hypothetical protein